MESKEQSRSSLQTDVPHLYNHPSVCFDHDSLQSKVTRSFSLLNLLNSHIIHYQIQLRSRTFWNSSYKNTTLVVFEMFRTVTQANVTVLLAWLAVYIKASYKKDILKNDMTLLSRVLANKVDFGVVNIPL